MEPRPHTVSVVGRYALHGVLATGGMATVHAGRLLGPVGFSRTVAIKRLHAQFAQDPEFVAMFLDEARLAARIRHPNAIAVTDVVAASGEVLLVMDYVQGETLSRLIRCATERGEMVPPRVVAAILCDTLDGLHAAHEARDEQGAPLGIVHRDVSPQNVMVGIDGVARVLDFGIAKAAGRSHVTREGQLKGKLAYMSPEQLHGKVSRQTDLYAAGIVLWETLTGKRLFAGDTEGETVTRILVGTVPLPSSEGAPPQYDAVVMKALSREPEDRFATAREMSMALAKVATRADPHEVGAWVEGVAKQLLDARAEVVSAVESAPLMLRPDGLLPAPSGPGADGPATRADLTTETTEAPRLRSALPRVAGGVAIIVVACVGVALLLNRGAGPTSVGAPGVSSGGSAPASTGVTLTPPVVPAEDHLPDAASAAPESKATAKNPISPPPSRVSGPSHPHVTNATPPPPPPRATPPQLPDHL